MVFQIWLCFVFILFTFLFWTGGDWVSFHRNAGFDIIDGNLRKSPEGSMSEMPLRHMMHVWRDYMTAEEGAQ